MAQLAKSPGDIREVLNRLNYVSAGTPVITGPFKGHRPHSAAEGEMNGGNGG